MISRLIHGGRAPRSRRIGFGCRLRSVRGRALSTEICIESRAATRRLLLRLGKMRPNLRSLPSKLRKSSEIFPSSVTLAIASNAISIERTPVSLFSLCLRIFTRCAVSLFSATPPFPRVLMDETSSLYLRFRNRGITPDRHGSSVAFTEICRRG